MHKLLIVEDNAQNLYMLEILLKTHGFEVELASNGAEALELAQKNPPDMVISDILMPVMDGFSLCRNWKADERLSKIPFVFYTATYTDPKDESFALSLGADRFLVKPISPDEFLAVIGEVSRTHQAREQVVLPEPAQKEEEYYKEYSEVLIHKLEQKTIQLERANKCMVSLYEASCKLLKIKLPAELIHCILEAIIEAGSYQKAHYFSFNESQNKLSLVDSIGFSGESLGVLIDEPVFINQGEEQSLVGQVARSGQTLNVGDTSNEPRWVAFDPTINAALFIPVLYEKHLLGVIGLYSVKKNAFTEEDEHNITALVNSLAVSIENRKIEEEIRQLNAQLEQRVAERTAQLENSNKELEAFAYSVSHDLRTPLRAIDGFSHILLEDYGDKLDAEGKRSLHTIRVNTQKMGELINDLLVLSRVSRSDLKLSRIDMATMVHSIYDEIASPEMQKEFTFTVFPLPDAYGDPVLLHQVWSNLILNAIKYTSPKDERIIQVNCHVEEDMNIYSIQDNGVGFDPEYTHKLFGVFERLHNPDQFEGTGVGLAIVKRIIERHRGRVWAEGRLNQGATFYFSIPQGQMN